MGCSADATDHVGPLYALFHGFSMFYCLTTSLAHGGAGLGTLGFHEACAKSLCLEAGFDAVERVALDSPFHALYLASREATS